MSPIADSGNICKVLLQFTPSTLINLMKYFCMVTHALYLGDFIYLLKTIKFYWQSFKLKKYVLPDNFLFKVSLL